MSTEQPKTIYLTPPMSEVMSKGVIIANATINVRNAATWEAMQESLKDVAIIDSIINFGDTA